MPFADSRLPIKLAQKAVDLFVYFAVFASIFALILVTFTFASSLPSPPPSLEGKWILVHQSYGKGEANLADMERPVYLEFLKEGNLLSGRIWAGEEPSEILSWPAFVNDQGTLPVEKIELQLDDPSGTVTAHYRVKPSPSDDLILDIREHYTITEQGDALVGKMEVTFMSSGKNKGSYTLHRRFERKQ